MAVINSSDLDFDQIKSNLKTYFQQQSEFADYDFEVPSVYLGYILLVAISISFVGSSQALYQCINKSITLLGFILISATLGVIYILNFNQSFIALVELFLISIFTLVIMVLIHLISLLLFNTNDLKESNSKDLQ